MCCFLMLWHKDFRPRETSCFHFQIIYLGLLFFLMPETPSFIPPPPTHTHTNSSPAFGGSISHQGKIRPYFQLCIYMLWLYCGA